MRRLLLPVLAAVLVLPATAHAAAPCRDKIYNDWYRDGKIASTYKIACYRDALKHVPNDARIYSNLGNDIRKAMQAALARQHGSKHVPAQVGEGLPSLARGSVKNTRSTLHTTTSEAPVAPARPRTTAPDSPRSPHEQLASAPVASTTSSGGGLPWPVILLGAVALLLAATGAIGAGVRRSRRREP